MSASGALAAPMGPVNAPRQRKVEPLLEPTGRVPRLMRVGLAAVTAPEAHEPTVAEQLAVEVRLPRQLASQQAPEVSHQRLSTQRQTRRAASVNRAASLRA